MSPIVQAEALTRRYVMGESVVTALNGVSLTVEEGECVAILGRSGSGKSTFLNLLGGLDRPTSGDVTVRGKRLGDLSDDALALYRRGDIGFVFQFFNLVPTLTAAQNVELPMTLAGRARQDRMRRSAELLDRVGLGARGGHRPGELSGGEQQRVAIARALVNDPPVLLADEPTGNLDSRTSEEVLRLLGGIGRKTVLLVTHDRTLAGGFARRTVEMSDGRVVADERR